MQNHFEGRTYLVTGASSGIGLACALRLAEQGARVVRVARDIERLDKTRKELPGDLIKDFSLDAADQEKVDSCLEECDVRSFSGALFCAGSHEVRPLRASKNRHYEGMFKSNVLSVTSFLPKMVKKLSDESSIVLVSSAATYRNGSAVSGYVAAKSALIGLTRSLALELAPKIRVNCISPGVVETPMSAQFLSSLSADAKTKLASRHPLGLGSPVAVADVALFLLSSQSRWVTGVDLPVDGGLTIAS